MSVVEQSKSIVEKAKALAATKHAGQVRKYTDEPYTCHLHAVVGLLERHGVTDPNVLAAAYLHDTVEDTETTVAEILDAFNEPVAELVYWLTDTETGNRSTRMTMAAWRLGRAPWDAKMIKLADIIDNSRTIVTHDPGFARKFLAEKKQVLAQMVRWEGQRLEVLPLFKQAAKLACAPEVDLAAQRAG
jgi:(p)ppGpp synthase/HD superfamily hydrolase